MPSTIPLLLGVLVLTGLTMASWRLIRGLMSRRMPPVQRAGEDLRIQAAVELLWTIVLLVHFVFLGALGESREVTSTLAMIGGISGGLCLVAALVSLVACISLERRLIAGR